MAELGEEMALRNKIRAEVSVEGPGDVDGEGEMRYYDADSRKTCRWSRLLLMFFVGSVRPSLTLFSVRLYHVACR
jgi:hypothetical protein